MSTKGKDKGRKTKQKNEVSTEMASPSQSKNSPDEMQQSSAFKTATSLKEKSSPVVPKQADKSDPKTATIIAYVHNLSPPKRNRRNTCDYSTVQLQTSSDDKQEALLYSAHKRSLFVESEKCRTPIKLQKFTYTDDNKKLIINDMTHVSLPKQSEYSFQYTNTAACRYQKVTVSEAIENCKEWDEIEVVGKIIKLGTPYAVQRKGQIASTTVDLCEAVLADTTASIRLDVWAANIQELKLGHVYCLRPVGIRLWSGQKKMTTTVNTLITAVEDEAYPAIEVQNCEDACVLGKTVIQVENILSGAWQNAEVVAIPLEYLGLSVCTSNVTVQTRNSIFVGIPWAQNCRTDCFEVFQKCCTSWNRLDRRTALQGLTPPHDHIISCC